MWRVVSLVVVVCLVCLFSVRAQTVNEKESSVLMGEKQIEVSLVLENLAASDAQISLELLDEKNEIRAQTAQNFKLKKGRGSYTLSLPLGDWTKKVNDDLVWYRLRYRIGTNAGIVSLSELIKDDFELRVAAGTRLAPGTNYRARIRALQPYTGFPVRNVKLSGELNLELDTEADEDELTLTASGETDAEGFALFDFAIPANVRLKDDGKLKINGEKRGVKREINEDTDALESKGTIFLSADKPIYQPGQTFNIRGLYFDANQNVLAGSELEFKVYDEDDTVLYRETVKTSAFGIASLAWKIPDNAKLGTYRVEVEDDDNDLDGDTMRFKVTRYDLPNFAVAAKTDKTFYLPNDKKAEITVRADYLFGKPVTQGNVRVVQETERTWNYKEQKYDIEEKQKFEGATDREGKFVANADLSEAVKTLAENEWSRYEDLHFAAYFTDSSTNKTEQKRFDVRVSREPIHIYFIRNDSFSLKLPFTAYVSTFYADGTPAVCDVEVKGKYENAGNSQSLTRIKTNVLGAGKIEFAAPFSEDTDKDYELEIVARDANRRTGTYDESLSPSEKDALKIETAKTIYKPGENIKVGLVSSKSDALVYFDVLHDQATLASYYVRLKNGRGELQIPYNRNFKGDLSLVAYTDETDSNYYYSFNGMKALRGIIYPAQQNLKLAADFTSQTYKPNEEAKISFSVYDGVNKPIESALGVVVFDKAVEERARTDEAFGSYFSRFGSLMGYDRSFGGISLKNLNDLDLSKPVSADLQLAAEIMLANQYFSPRIYRTNIDPTGAKDFYVETFKRQFAPIEKILRDEFNKTYEHPTDDASLRRMLSAKGFDFDYLRDPWNQPYRAEFSIDKSQNIVTIKSAGANKIFGDRDDFVVSSSRFTYFTPVGRKIDEAVLDFYNRTGEIIRNYETLRGELLKLGVGLDNLKDRWGHPYRLTFETFYRTYIIRIRSNGKDGIENTYYQGDDFDIWTTRTDYFAKTESRIFEILNRSVNRQGKPFPQSEAEFKKLLRDNNLNFDELRDGYGNPPYLIFKKEARYADTTKIENGKQTITPTTQEVFTFKIRTMGEKTKENSDDFDLAEFSSVVFERLRDTVFSKAPVKNVATSSAKGAVSGQVLDAGGAVVTNATITATDDADNTKTFSTTSNDKGDFLLANVPSGTYSIRIDSPGFKSSVFSGIQVRSQNRVVMTVTLEVGSVSETVTVTSDAALSVDSTDSRVQTSISSNQVEVLPKGTQFVSLLKLNPGVAGKGKNEITTTEENSTPRLREYFPETLVWSPELLTDKNGKAEMKFKLADNITTWKLYTIASTKNGKVGVAEKEIQAFQPFFVDLDPPKFLTEGDEIHLPTQVRNYTGTKQKVSVSMTQADWFSPLDSLNQKIEVEAGNSANAVFGFKALGAIKNAKQRITAIAAKDSDAIEKPVTVRPNGQEVVATDSRLFNKTMNLSVNFPAETLPKTQKAELKIYPNLMAHVTESVTGLLQRPYGCGEQTVSSTYPNLMILKFIKDNSKLRSTAQKYLQAGYERLIGYQVEGGGFSYWGGKDVPDVALTAYAIRFLTDAEDFIEVDENVVKRAKDWLTKQQRTDGSFTKLYYYEKTEDARRTKLITSYVARTLAMLKERDDKPLQKALEYLKAKNAEIDEPYALSLYALASLDAGNAEDAGKVIQTLEKLAIPEGSGVYWNLEANTPFYGWGTAGRIETTALVVQSLIKAKAQNKESNNEKLDELIAKGTLFLLKTKDRYGVWYSTQTTINVLDAFLAALDAKPQTENQTLQIILNGANVQNVTVSAAQIEPIILNLDEKLNQTNNQLEIRSSNDSPVMAQVVAAHYIDWKNADFSGQTANQSRQLELNYKCDKQTAKIMEEVSCAVSAERVGFRGYGMLLAEIGIPPGADVSRESLQEAMQKDSSLSRYDVLPDRIVLYMWSKAGGTKFDFKFKPRYGINAQTPASIVYDYYNEEAKATIAPLRFNVR